MKERCFYSTILLALKPNTGISMSIDLKEKSGVLIIFLFMLLQGIFFGLYIYKASSTQQLVLHTYKVLNQLEKLDNNLSKAENAIASKQPQIESSIDQKIKNNLNELKDLVIDNPSQLAFITSLEKEIPLIFNPIDKKNSTSDIRIHTIVNKMIQAENKLLDVRYVSNKQAENALLFFLAISFLLAYSALFIIMGLFISSKHDLEEREERLNLAVRGTSDALWDWDPNTNKVFYSPRLLIILGYKDNEWAAILDEFSNHLHPDDYKPVGDAIKDHLKNHTHLDIECRLRHKDGHYIWFNLRGQATWDINGKAIRMSGFITDIDHKKEIERIKDEFVSTVSHELRTPLTSIRGSLGLILAGTEGPLTKDMRYFLDIAYSNSERLIFLINDILDMDKIESNKMRFDIKRENLAELIRHSVELNKSYSEKYNVAFNVVEPLSDVDVLVDSNRFIQVMTNLLSNAAKFSGDSPKIDILTAIDKNMVRISVTDYGVGIPAGAKESLFNKFSQIHNQKQKQGEGTGLGLYICKQLIEKMGGYIYFESNPEQGTTFFFELPMVLKEAAQAPNNHITVQNHPKLLICEDDYKVAEFLKNIATKMGFEVDVSTSVSQARSFLHSKSYAGLILDLILPDQYGIELIFELRSDPMFQAMPIIIVSIKSIEEEKVYGESLGIVDWLTKPLNAEALISAINKISINIPKPVVLYIEDDEGLINIISHSLQGIAEVIPAQTLAKAKDIIAKQNIDLILLDIILPDGNGLEIVNYIDESKPLPVIILSANDSPENISKQVAATFIKSCTSEETIINTIKQMINQNQFKGDTNERT